MYAHLKLVQSLETNRSNLFVAMFELSEDVREEARYLGVHWRVSRLTDCPSGTLLHREIVWGGALRPVRHIEVKGRGDEIDVTTDCLGERI